MLNIVKNEDGTFTVNDKIKTRDEMLDEILDYNLPIDEECDDEELIDSYVAYLNVKYNPNCVEEALEEAEEELLLNGYDDIPEDAIDIINEALDSCDLRQYIEELNEDCEDSVSIKDLDDVLSGDYTPEQLKNVFDIYLECVEALEDGFDTMYPNGYDPDADWSD